MEVYYVVKIDVEKAVPLECKYVVGLGASLKTENQEHRPEPISDH